MIIGRLLCWLFGHPKSQEVTITLCDGKLVAVGCARCGEWTHSDT